MGFGCDAMIDHPRMGPPHTGKSGTLTGAFRVRPALVEELAGLREQGVLTDAEFVRPASRG